MKLTVQRPFAAKDNLLERRIGFHALYLLVFSTTNIQAQTSKIENLIGLVEVPEIFGKSDPSGPPGQKSPKKVNPIKLYIEPNELSKIVVQVANQDELISRDHGYEEKSAVAFERKGDWFLIKTKTNKGWLSPKAAGQFHRYEDLLEKNLSYLNKNWNGRLYSAPDDSKKFEQQKLKFKDEGNYANWMISQSDVKILDKKMSHGQLWLKIQFVDGRCESEEKLKKKAWVPAYSEKGDENFWFTSRGC